MVSDVIFLSTLSLRRATVIISFHPRADLFLSTLSLRRATWEYWVGGYGTAFLSTLSLRRATHYGWSWYDDFTISIHALLAESDKVPPDNAACRPPFLSTLSLRRATSKEVTMADFDKIFLSTLSLRRATSWGGFSECIYAFLSTLSLRRATMGCIP